MLPGVFVFTLAAAMEFTPYRASEQYKCGAFLQNRIDDQTLNYYYSTITNFITLLSNPFPHEELLNRQALVGDLNEVRLSIENKSLDWWSWQKGWLISAGVLAFIGVSVPILYLLYRCCLCCCRGSTTKENTDSRYDGCKRNLFNAIMALLVLIDVFAAATLLIAGQYAQFGMEELPNRLNYCIDDLNLYKRDTDARIRKLLIDDYQMLNRTVSSQLSDAGHEVVERVKKLTGANVVDVLMNISRSATEIEGSMRNVQAQFQQIVTHYSAYQVEYRRMQHTLAEDLQQCRQDQVESVKAMCHKAAKALESMTPPPLEINMGMVSFATDATLEPIIRANIPQLLANTNRNFDSIQNRLQTEIDKKVHSSQEILKRIADDLFVAAETISTQIRQINFDVLYDMIAHASDPKDNILVKIVHYSKTFSLVITSVIMLIAFCFLLGLFYGICGRRPTFYNDDCCVRTTGGRFYSCGIWMTVVTFTALFALATTLFFIIGNTSDLVCRTLRDPLSRPDMISLGERYLEIVRSKQRPDDVLVSIMGEHSLADLIRSCQRNETLYEMFHLDKKYQLKRLKQYEKDAYERLERFLNTTLTDIPKLAPMDNLISKEDFGRLEQLATINMSGVSHFALAKVSSTIAQVDLEQKVSEFEGHLDSRGGRPKAISSMLEQVQDINTRIARPLRVKLETLLKNLTRLNKRFDEMQVPISALLRKLQHAQALLSDDLRGNVEKAAREQLDGIFANLNQYIDHVKFQMEHEVSSCVPIRAIASSSTAAFCDHTIDPLNGAWMSMLISLLCLIPMLFFATLLVNLYNKMHSFPKYVVEAPPDHNQMSSFITDIYDTRQKPGHTNYSYTDNYQRTFR